MSSGPDDNVDRLLHDIARVIDDNNRFLSKLLDDDMDLEDESLSCSCCGDDDLPDLNGSDEFEEL